MIGIIALSKLISGHKHQENKEYAYFEGVYFDNIPFFFIRILIPKL